MSNRNPNHGGHHHHHHVYHSYDHHDCHHYYLGSIMGGGGDGLGVQNEEEKTVLILKTHLKSHSKFVFISRISDVEIYVGFLCSHVCLISN